MINIPNFTIEKEVGHGGMATVYLAMQDMLSRHVALKVLLPDMMKDENLRKSFLSEGKIVASLDHPNIVRIHDIGIVDETTFYMSMEYLSGGTLKEKMAEGKLAFPEAKHILEEIAKGLAYAHNKGYIHRDIKPGNILFRDNGSAVITDFGIAKLQDSSGELTRLGFTLGTVQYMSPEQATTTDLDSRSDIYSLGLVFYEMLTGQKAFKADSNIQAIHQHTTVPPPLLPKEYAPLQEVMDKVLAKEPGMRYQTVSEFVEAVNNPPPLSKIEKAPEDTIHTDKTVIHSVNDFPVAGSTTTPLLKGEGAKKKSILIPAILGGVAMMGAIAYGIMNFSNFQGNTGSTKKISAGESQEEKSLLRLKQEDLAKQQKKAEEERKYKEEQAKLKAIKLAEEKRKQEELIKQQTKQEKIEKERKQQEAIALKIADELEKQQLRKKEIEIEKQQAIEAERKQQEALAIKKATEEKERQESLAKEQEEEQKRLEALAKKKEEEALAEEKAEEKKQALLDKERIAKEKATKEKKQKEALERKLEKEKQEKIKANLAKKNAAKAAKKKKDLARKKALEKKRKIAAAKALAKKKADAKRIAIQKQQGQKGHIKIAVTLNKKPLKTKIVVTRSGKHVKTIVNSYANLTLPAGNYVVTAFYGGKSSKAAINLGAYETSIQRFAFRGSTAPAKRSTAQPVPGKVITSPSDPNWTHTHVY